MTAPTETAPAAPRTIFPSDADGWPVFPGGTVFHVWDGELGPHAVSRYASFREADAAMADVAEHGGRPCGYATHPGSGQRYFANYAEAEAACDWIWRQVLVPFEVFGPDPFGLIARRAAAPAAAAD